MKENIYVRLDNRKYITKVEKIMRFLYRVIGVIRIEENENGVILLLPVNYKKRRYKTKVEKFIKKRKDAVVVYSKDIDEGFFNTDEISMYTGKKIMKYILDKLIDYIFEITKQNKLLEDIYLFVNEYNKENLEIIDELVHSFKTVNIITSKISKFKILESKYERNNVLITVSNNKRKGAKRANLIINFDFDNYMFQKYEIPNKAIIINLHKDSLKPKYNFDGIIVNNYNIIIDNEQKTFFEEFYGNIESKIMLESLINNSNYQQTKKWLEYYEIRIAEIVGIRGIITKNEVIQNYKNNC